MWRCCTACRPVGWRACWPEGGGSAGIENIKNIFETYLDHKQKEIMFSGTMPLLQWTGWNSSKGESKNFCQDLFFKMFSYQRRDNLPKFKYISTQMTNGATQACGSEAENERDTESKLVLFVVMSFGTKETLGTSSSCLLSWAWKTWLEAWMGDGR